MADNQNINDLLKVEYDVIVRRKGKRYAAFIRELNLFAEGKSIAEAIDTLDEKKISLFTDMIESGFHDDIPAPKNKPQREFFNMLPVVYSTVLVFSIVGALTWFSIPYFIDRAMSGTTNWLSSAVYQLVPSGERLRTGIRLTLRNISESLEKLTPERREEMLRDLRTIVTAARPFLDEVTGAECDTCR